MIKRAQDNKLPLFGFRFERGGTHTSRTMMLEDLKILIAYVNNDNAKKEIYAKAIEVDNCLGKRSGITRKLATRHLGDLYGLDPSLTIFRSLLFFWERDKDSHALLALLCAYARDPILRLYAPCIFSIEYGKTFTKEALEEFIDKKESGRFSSATLKSTANNLNSTWTQAGYLTGRVKKIRSKAIPTPGSTAYSLLIGYLSGVRGEELFKTEYVKLLDCTIDRAIEFAEEASRRGWIVFKRVGSIIEVLFPQLLTSQEIEWIHEQNQASYQFIQ